MSVFASHYHHIVVNTSCKDNKDNPFASAMQSVDVDVDVADDDDDDIRAQLQAAKLHCRVY